MEYKYSPGQNVLYNGECNTIFRKRLSDDNKAAYLIRNIKSGTTVDKVLETELSECTLDNVIDTIWSSFVYTGDNLAASDFVLKAVEQTSCCKEISYGPNEDNTAYILRYCCEMENVMKEVVKNKTA